MRRLNTDACHEPTGALARANRAFCPDKMHPYENAVMQLLRNNCHIRANDFVI